jgi:glycosyltransferase involved in cell wall biosynthesis
MRYAYIKYGNVVEELRRIGVKPAPVPRSGPDTFSAGFISMVGDHPAMLLSAHGVRERLRMGAIDAISLGSSARQRKPLAGWKLFLLGCRFLLGFRPDVVVCTCDGALLWASFLTAKLLKARLVHSRQRTIRSQGDSWRRVAAGYGDRFVMRRADALLCHGPFTRGQLQEAGVQPENIHEFDVDLGALLARTAAGVLSAGDRPPSARQVLFVGRLEESKGIFELFEACVPILRACPGVELVYVGEGSARRALAERVERAGLAERVLLKGRVPHEHVGPMLRAATVLVTPTRRGLEGWPMSALEGLAAGVPVVAPAAGPFLCMITDGVNGLLFAPDSVADLRAKLDQVLDDAALAERLRRGAVDSAKDLASRARGFADALEAACAKGAAG